MGKGESGLQCRCNKPTDQHRSANGWLGFLASSVFTATTAEAAAAVHTAWRPIKHKNAGFARQQRSEVKEEDETVGKIKLRLMDPRSQKHTFFVCKKLNNIGGFRTSLVHRSQFSFSVLNDGGEQKTAPRDGTSILINQLCCHREGRGRSAGRWRRRGKKYIFLTRDVFQINEKKASN